MEKTVTKEHILAELRKWEVCDYFLRKGLQQLSASEIEKDAQLFRCFLDANQLNRLQAILSNGLRAFGKTKEELRQTRQYGFSGKFNKENFEAFRGVMRAGPALQRRGFTNLVLVEGYSLADVCAEREAVKWAIEVKTLVYRDKDWTGGELGIQKNSKIEWVARQISNEHVSSAKRQLDNLTNNEACAKRVLLEVVNRDFVTGLFFAKDDFASIHGKLTGAGTFGNSIDHIGFLANADIQFFPELESADGGAGFDRR